MDGWRFNLSMQVLAASRRRRPRDERESDERGELCVPARAHGATAAPMAAAAVVPRSLGGSRGAGTWFPGEGGVVVVVGFNGAVCLVAVELVVVVEISACSRHDINIAPAEKRGWAVETRRADDIEPHRHRSFNAVDGCDSARQLKRLRPPRAGGSRSRNGGNVWRNDGGARRSWPALLSRRPSSEVSWRRGGETQGRLRAERGVGGVLGA